MKKISFSKLFYFHQSEILKCPKDYGVYVFRTKEPKKIIYVGMAERQFIRERLKQHYDKTNVKNDRFRNWLYSDFECFFQYYVCDQKLTRELEKFLIVKLRPFCNEKSHLERRIDYSIFKKHVIRL